MTIAGRTNISTRPRLPHSHFRRCCVDEGAEGSGGDEGSTDLAPTGCKPYIHCADMGEWKCDNYMQLLFSMCILLKYDGLLQMMYT